MIRVLLLALFVSGSAWAQQANIDVNTPAIQALTAKMQSRHGELAPLYAAGAVGQARDGLVAMRDPAAVPLSQRQAVGALVAAENQDRNALYREIARANGHPEWEAEIRGTFAQRWTQRAQPGWWVQDPGGAWVRK